MTQTKKVILLTAVIGIIFTTLVFFTSANTEGNGITDEYMKNYNVYALQTPETASFANEKTPLKKWYVKESLDRELLVNTYWQSNMLLLLKRSQRYLPTITKILKQEGVPEDFKYLAVAESGLIPTIVSPAGAAGIWQFMKGTAKDYGLEVNKEVDERYHLEKATRAACQYLKDARDSLGNWTLAAAAYNAGRKGIRKQMERQNMKNYYDLLLNDETGRYVYRILAIKTIMENPKKYGFKFTSKDLYEPIPTKKIAIKTPIEDFAVWAKDNGINYLMLKKLNPWLRQKYLKNKHKKTYYIRVPE